MTPLRTTCTYCGEVTHVAPTEIFLALDAGTQITGDREATATLLAAGVRPVAVDEAPGRHPEAPPAGPPFTRDDVLSIHLLLNTETWFEQLLSLS